MSLRGQLAAAAATLYTAPDECKVSLNLANTASTTETVVVTVLTSAGSYRIARRALLANEQVVLSGIELFAGEQLQGVTTNASAVDYSVTFTPMTVATFDATGTAKGALAGNAVTLGSLAIGASTAAAGTTTANATGLPAGTAPVYPTTGATDATGVIINVADQVTGRLLFIGNGVSNKILKVYPPSGGVINGAVADVAFSSVSGKGVLILCLSGTGNTWLAW